LLDDDGQLVWGVSDFSLVPYQQILRSAEAGVLKGNPRRLYIIRGFPQADLDLIPWASLVIRGALADACVYRNDVEAILPMLGFEFDADEGVWRPRRPGENELLDAIARVIHEVNELRLSHDLDEARLLRDLFEHIAREGRATKPIDPEGYIGEEQTWE
jgi:hypothetical protein